jgi:hypothetical protein
MPNGGRKECFEYKRAGDRYLSRLILNPNLAADADEYAEQGV